MSRLNMNAHVPITLCKPDDAMRQLVNFIFTLKSNTFKMFFL